MSFPYVTITLSPEQVEQASALLLTAGSSGLETQDVSTMVPAAAGEVVVIGWFDAISIARRAAELIRQSLGESLHIDVGETEDPGWREAWREYFRPMRFGRRLWVTPPDEDPPAHEMGEDTSEPAIVRLVPSGAFGTGTHESTALMLELIDELLEPECTVLDVGCGSGILSIAAALLGAKGVWGVDIDPEAVFFAQKNCSANGQERRCTFDETPIALIGEHFDLVFANLSAPVLISEREELVKRVGTSGVLLWSGLLETDLEEVGAPSGLTLAHDLRRNGWVAQAWRR